MLLFVLVSPVHNAANGQQMIYDTDCQGFSPLPTVPIFRHRNDETG